jgi:Omp85 superfamily domain
LFDILINDWDRHDDQWRWASFKEDGKTIFRPIPRDRDQVYFLSEGILMWFASRSFLMPKFQRFENKIENVKGLGFNARFFDRFFAVEAGLDLWMAEAKYLQDHISDSIIHCAVLKMPPEVYAVSGPKIEEKLKSRLKDLPEYAHEYYRFLAKTTDVTGTDKRDLFSVERLEDGSLDVSVFELSDKKGKVKDRYFHRVFYPGQSKEVRLYGLDGKDKFEVRGKAKKGIKLRMIGGKGKDVFMDSSFVNGFSKKNIIYDRSDKENKFQVGRESRLVLSPNQDINLYDRRQFKWNKIMPLVFMGYNIDDGFYLGGGLKIKNYNFRDSSMHKITGSLAFLTGAVSMHYDALLSALPGKYNLLLNAEIDYPRNVDNYFGAGNNSKRILEAEKYYRLRYKNVVLNPMLNRKFYGKLELSFGAFYQFIHITDTGGRYVNTLYKEGVLNKKDFDPQQYLGANIIARLDTRDDDILPTKGFDWKSSAVAYHNISSKADNFIKLSSDFRLFLSPSSHSAFVLALRAGGAFNLGEYKFYHANFLGGKSNLRGFQSHRFAGDASLYQNTELRVKLTNIKSYLFKGQCGVFLFNDVGRVWLKDENSERWHQGYGMGLWLYPFDFAIVSMSYNLSKEDDLFVISFNFLF